MRLRLFTLFFIILVSCGTAFSQSKSPDEDFAKGSPAGSLEGYYHFSKETNIYGFFGRYGKYFADNIYWTVGLGYSHYRNSTPYQKPHVTSNGSVYNITSHMYTDANYLHVPVNLGYVVGKLRGFSLRIEGGLMANYIMSMKVGESSKQENVSDYDHFGFVPTLRAAVGVYSFHLYLQYNISKSSMLMYGFAFQW